jgi:hypothetical protein
LDVLVKDFDNDGRQDLAVLTFGASGTAEMFVSLYLVDGAGDFKKAASVRADSAVLLKEADFNGDGKLDIITLDINSNAPSKILLGGCDNAPTINGSLITRAQGSSAANSVIATNITDAQQAPDTLTVTVNGKSASGGDTVTSGGVTISNLVIAPDGTATADVAVACDATTPKVDFTLRVTDGHNYYFESRFTVKVTLTLSYPSSFGLTLNNSIIIAPTTKSEDIIDTSSFSVVSQGNYTGGISVDNRGRVSINNAYPAGTHTITIRLTSKCGLTKDASFSLVVRKKDQTITFGPLANKTFGDPDFTVSATSTSQLPVNFAPVGSCTLIGNSTIRITGAGTCTVTAFQNGNNDYNSALYVHQTFTISKRNQTISVSSHAPSGAKYGDSFTVAATSDSGLPVIYSSSGSCTNTGATFRMSSGTGICSVKYNQAGSGNYNAAAQVTESVTAQKVDQTITFGALGNKTYGNSDFLLSASASSNLPVTFGAVGQCTVNGRTVHLTGAGSCTITASEAGNANYNAATPVSQSFTISKATPLITWNNPSAIISGTALSGAQLNAMANVLGTFQYTPAAGTVLTVGTHQLSVSFTPSDAANYNSASASVQLIVETPTLQLILDETEPNQAVALEATLFLRDPFPVINTGNLPNQGADKNTRVIIFVSNLQLAQDELPSAVIVHLTDAHGINYEAEAEDVQLVPLFDFTQVRFRLPDNLSPGTCTIKVRAHGQESNSGTIRIRS